MRKRTETGRNAIRITRLRLENWKNFQDLDIDLQGRAIFVGPNASGKSNLLDAILFLRDLVVVGGGFRKAVENRNGVSAIRALAARRYSDIVVQVDLGAEASGEVAWRYRLTFNQDHQRLPVLRQERIETTGKILVNRPNDDDRADPARLSQTFLEQVNVNRAFREISECFQSVRYLHLIPQLVRQPGRFRRDSPAEDVFGAGFLETIAKTPQKTRNAWLNRIRKALTVAVPQLSDFEFYWDKARGEPHLRGKYRHWRPQGAWQTEDQFSDGTLRLLGILWCALENRGPLLLEEPELSLHPEVVRHIPTMLARMQSRTGRQVLLSTHSRDMLLDPGIGLDEVFLLKPTAEGTKVESAARSPRLRAEAEGGIPLSELVVPETAPAGAHRLSMFE